MIPEIGIGIDLGTTFSVAAHLDRDGHVVTILNAEGDLKTPSVLFFDDDSIIVGREADKAAMFEPNRAARFVKREMGRRYCQGRLDGKHLPPEVIQACILQKLRRDIELKLGRVTQAVITVPAFFNEPRRKATEDAGRLAGIEVLDIINEPTAAAVCYGVQREFLTRQGESHSKETILVYDLGGGTFDATLMEIDGHVYRTLGTCGDVFLGGMDWDERLADFLAGTFLLEHDIDLRNDPVQRERLLHEAVEAKHSLTARSETTVHLSAGNRRCRIRVSRNEFEEMTQSLLERTLFTVRKVLRDADRQWSDVTRLLLVGGSSRMPAVKEQLQRESGITPDCSLSPDEAVAHGAAIYAGLLQKHQTALSWGISLSNVNSHDLGIVGIERISDRKRRHVMIPRNTPLPAKKEFRFETYKDGQPNVVVNIVEGGDAAGNNATAIGRCLVKDLPPGLPAKTSVLVKFHYGVNGRLKVTSRLPSVNCAASVDIERAIGLPENELAIWQEKIASGKLFAAEAIKTEPIVNESSSSSAESSGSIKQERLSSSPRSVKNSAHPPPLPLTAATTNAPQSVTDHSPLPAESKRADNRSVKRRFAPVPPPKATPNRGSRKTAAPAKVLTKPISAAEQKPPVTAAKPVTTSKVVTVTVPLVRAPLVDSPIAVSALSVAVSEIATAAASKPEFPPVPLSNPPVPLSNPPVIEPLPLPVALDEDERENSSLPYVLRKQQLAVFAVSTLLHLLALLILAYIMLPEVDRDSVLGILSSPPAQKKPLPLIVKIEPVEPTEIEKKETETKIVKPLLADTKDLAELNINDLAPSADLFKDAPAPVAAAPNRGEYGGRSTAGRAAAVARYGGTKESEAAVNGGLKWLARHQDEDGSWSFNHVRAACRGSCTSPGSFGNSRMGATAMALLTYLSAGDTYSTGDFQSNVKKGLEYLLANGKNTSMGGDFRGKYDGNGGMYIQGLVAITLCEAYAMSLSDLRRKSSRSKSKFNRRARFAISRKLRYAAQSAIHFIGYAQSSSGGWRYTPRRSADTSVVGWQVLALASAYAVKLRVPPVTLSNAARYLDSVQSQRGSQYAYVPRQGPRKSMTAVGLLCRIYLQHWGPGRDQLRYGVQYLSQQGPDRRDMYYNYYATQVMHQYGGPMWKKWNKIMRDQLVNSQKKSGHATGSWDVTDIHGGPGGRLYQTCLSIMTLEVYYRHLPLFQYRGNKKTESADKSAAIKKTAANK